MATINGSYASFFDLLDAEENMFSEMSNNASLTNQTSTNQTEAAPIDANRVLMMSVYRIVVPATFILCCIAFFLNCMILLLVKWLRRPFSNTIVLTIALATADCWACSMFGASYIVLSYLPIVAGVYVSQCISLALEALKFSAVITSVLHLDLLAVSHYLAIAYPMDHRRYLSQLRIKVLIAVFFIVPPVVLLTVFGSIPGQSFQSIECEEYPFYFEYSFRVTLFMCLFVVPFGLIAVLYVGMLKHLATLSKQRQRWAALANPPGVAVTALNYCPERAATAAANHGNVRRLASLPKSPNHEELNQVVPTSNPQSLSSSMASLAIRGGASVTPAGGVATMKSIQRKKRTLLTTLMMVSSFLVGWLPAGLAFVLTCNGGWLAPVLQQYPMAGFALGVTTNLLITLKYLGNPVIYAFRVPEIRDAFRSALRLRGGVKRRRNTDSTVTASVRNLRTRRSSDMNSEMNEASVSLDLLSHQNGYTASRRSSSRSGQTAMKHVVSGLSSPRLMVLHNLERRFNVRSRSVPSQNSTMTSTLISTAESEYVVNTALTHCSAAVRC